jgi:hypothetical protein
VNLILEDSLGLQATRNDYALKVEDFTVELFGKKALGGDLPELLSDQVDEHHAGLGRWLVFWPAGCLCVQLHVRCQVKLCVQASKHDADLKKRLPAWNEHVSHFVNGLTALLCFTVVVRPSENTVYGKTSLDQVDKTNSPLYTYVMLSIVVMAKRWCFPREFDYDKVFKTDDCSTFVNNQKTRLSNFGLYSLLAVKDAAFSSHRVDYKFLQEQYLPLQRVLQLCTMRVLAQKCNEMRNSINANDKQHKYYFSVSNYEYTSYVNVQAIVVKATWLVGEPLYYAKRLWQDESQNPKRQEAYSPPPENVDDDKAYRIVEDEEQGMRKAIWTEAAAAAAAVGGGGGAVGGGGGGGGGIDDDDDE